MKKDKKWLREEVYKLIESYTSFGGHEHTFIIGANVDKLGDLIDQLDEPEVLSTEVKKDKKWAQKEVDRYLSYEGVNEARNALVFTKGVIDQLDEPEVLSHEWIDKNKTSIDRKLDGTPIYKVREELLQNLLVPKQEEVDRAYKDGYETGKQHTFYKGYLEGLADKESEPETVADVLADFYKSLERLKKVLGTKVEDLEE